MDGHGWAWMGMAGSICLYRSPHTAWGRPGRAAHARCTFRGYHRLRHLVQIIIVVSKPAPLPSTPPLSHPYPRRVILKATRRPPNVSLAHQGAEGRHNPLLLHHHLLSFSLSLFSSPPPRSAGRPGPGVCVCVCPAAKSSQPPTAFPLVPWTLGEWLFHNHSPRRTPFSCCPPYTCTRAVRSRDPTTGPVPSSDRSDKAQHKTPRSLPLPPPRPRPRSWTLSPSRLRARSPRLPTNRSCRRCRRHARARRTAAPTIHFF